MTLSSAVWHPWMENISVIIILISHIGINYYGLDIIFKVYILYAEVNDNQYGPIRVIFSGKRNMHVNK